MLQLFNCCDYLFPFLIILICVFNILMLKHKVSIQKVLLDLLIPMSSARHLSPVTFSAQGD